MQQSPVIFNASANVFEEIPNGDTLNPVVIPPSARSNNLLQVLSDGLYVGNQLALPQLYINTSTGVDAPTSGSITTPFASLGYVLNTFLGGVLSGLHLTISLQAGQSFTLPNDFTLSNGARLIINSYGDSSGNGGSYISGTQTLVDVGTNLNRPSLANVSSSANAYYGCTKFVLQDESKLILNGLYINLPMNPGSISSTAYGTFCDLVSVGNGETGYVSLLGTYVNMQDPTSMCGFAGIQARGQSLRVVQFASQFLVQGAKVISSSTVAALNARQNFLKFYADFAGNNQLATSVQPTSLTSSAGTGLMFLTWSDVAAQIITGSETNVATYPYLSDTSYGLKFYFTGLIRDQQSRPMNAISGRLF